MFLTTASGLEGKGKGTDSPWTSLIAAYGKEQKAERYDKEQRELVLTSWILTDR